MNTTIVSYLEVLSQCILTDPVCFLLFTFLKPTISQFSDMPKLNASNISSIQGSPLQSLGILPRETGCTMSNLQSVAPLDIVFYSFQKSFNRQVGQAVSSCLKLQCYSIVKFTQRRQVITIIFMVRPKPKTNLLNFPRGQKHQTSFIKSHIHMIKYVCAPVNTITGAKNHPVFMKFGTRM